MTTFYTVTKVVRTSAPLEEVVDATREALNPIGGSMKVNRKTGSIYINDGKSGVTGGALLDCSATVKIRKKGEDKYLIKCDLEKRPGLLFWLLLIGGFCFPPWPWIGNILYLFIDLGSAYRNRLDSLEIYL